jgi:hypothetical protein
MLHKPSCNWTSLYRLEPATDQPNHIMAKLLPNRLKHVIVGSPADWKTWSLNTEFKWTRLSVKLCGWYRIQLTQPSSSDTGPTVIQCAESHVCVCVCECTTHLARLFLFTYYTRFCTPKTMYLISFIPDTCIIKYISTVNELLMCIISCGLMAHACIYNHSSNNNGS